MNVAIMYFQFYKQIETDTQTDRQTDSIPSHSALLTRHTDGRTVYPLTLLKTSSLGSRGSLAVGGIHRWLLGVFCTARSVVPESRRREERVGEGEGEGEGEGGR